LTYAWNINNLAEENVEIKSRGNYNKTISLLYNATNNVLDIGNWIEIIK
jgi:hypothetical protein